MVKKRRNGEMSVGETKSVPIAPVNRFPKGFIRKLAESKAKKDNDPNKIDSKEEWRMLEEAVSKAEESDLSHWSILMDIKRESLKIEQVGISPREILQTIGKVYMIDHDNGKRTMASVLTYEGVKSLGINFKEVLKGCGSPNADWNENKYDKEKNPKGIVNKRGYLVNLDLYQQVALLKAIAEKILKDQRDKVGFYNLRGSRKIYEVLGVKEKVYGKLRIYWMWTGEKYILGKVEEAKYPDDAIVTLGDLKTLRGNHFCYRFVNIGHWGDVRPRYHSPHGAVVLGAQF